MITHAYPLVKELQQFGGIRIASLEYEDIAAMKLNAIIGNGTRLKDFIDIAFLSCHLSLKTMMDAYENKYSARNPIVSTKALLYNEDINFKEPVKMISGIYSWKPVRQRLFEMEKFPARIFSQLALNIKN